MRLRVFASVFVLLVCSLAARADSFNFSFGSATDTFAGSGVLTATQLSASQYLVTAVTGTTRTTLNGVDRVIDSILPVGTFLGNDNLLSFANGVYSFDVDGLSYSLRNGALVNLFTANGEYLQRVGGALVLQDSKITITPVAATAAAPEPSSLALVGTGILGVVGVMRRRMAPAS